MSRCVALLLIAVLILSSLMMVEPAFAQSIPKPSVPEFTVQYADHSYDVLVSTSKDPFTGKTVTNPAQHIENKTIQITIKNQTISSSDYLYYEIRMKGRFSQEWTNISFIQANPHSEYTELTYAIAGNNASGNFDSRLDEISSGGRADFQVQAQIWRYIPSDDFYSQFGGGWHFSMSDYSDWSNTQTITIPASDSSPSSSPSPTSTPDQTTEHTANESSQTLQLTAIIGTIIAVVLVSAVLMVYFKKLKR